MPTSSNNSFGGNVSGAYIASINAVGLPAAPGGPRAAGPVLRAAVFYDGFNLYHAIDDLGEPHLKWLNLRALAEKFVRNGHSVTSILWCSAQHTRNTGKLVRHRAYKRALESVGVECLLGHFIEEPIRCKANCREDFWVPVEKQGDVNVAIRLISDAHLDLFDVGYLVTADSDQVATAKLFASRFPQKQLISVAPPGRQHSKDILQFVAHAITISKPAIENSLFGGPNLVKLDGSAVAVRPGEYAPPTGWKPLPYP